MKINAYLFLLLIIFMNSCKVFLPNRMFKQGNYEYFQVDKKIIDEYIIQKGDLLSLEVFTREGFDLVDVLKRQGGTSNSGSQGYTYLVEEDGSVEFPLYGKMQVVGYTANELEDLIESRSEGLFKEPFVILKVTNRRAFVFKGSTAQVVSLNEGPTNLLEVIAKSGGLANELKAHKIKIIRGDLKNPEIIKVDLSTIKGLQDAELTIQSNDIVYVERRFRVASELLAEITPIISLATSLTTIIVLVNNLRKQ